MAYYPKERNVNGVFYHGAAGSDQVFETNSNFTYDTSTNTAQVTSTGMTVAGITGQIQAPTGNGSDLILIASGSELRKLPISTLSASLGGGTMNNWELSADNGTSQTVSDTNQVDFSGAGNITISQDESSAPYRVVVSGDRTSFQLDGDSGPTQTVDDSDTVAILGGTGLSTVTTAGENLTVNITGIDGSMIVDGTITNSDLANSSVTVQGDAGSATLSLGETLDIGGGSGIATTVAGGSPEQVTVDLTVTSVTAGSYGSSTAVGTFTVDANGRLTAASDVNIADLNINADVGGSDAVSLGETLTIAGGSGIETNRDANNQITINAALLTVSSGTLAGGSELPNDVNVLDVAGGSESYGLPATPPPGQLIRVKKGDSSANTITITGNAGKPIDGGSSYILYNQWESVTLISEEDGWFVF
jgi:hypothetical protein